MVMVHFKDKFLFFNIFPSLWPRYGMANYSRYLELGSNRNLATEDDAQCFNEVTIHLVPVCCAWWSKQCLSLVARLCPSPAL